MGLDSIYDDTLSVWDSKNIFLDFLAFLNTLHPGIKWTNEMEEEGKLAIFDILIIRTETGYDTTVYRKKSASDGYIHYTSAQGWNEKACTINTRTLKSREIDSCSNEALLAEKLAYLHEVFMSNGYPERTVWRMLYQENRREHNKVVEIDMAKSLYVPYHPRAKRVYTMLLKR